MIADGHMLVVGQQRIVGPEQPTDVHGVVDAGVEVRVVADAGGQVQPYLGARDQMWAGGLRLVGVGQQG
ncbi:hypothetical protein D3C75_1330330 [compost metagenome]